MQRAIAGTSIVVIALVLQTVLAGGHVFANIALAVLIALAFSFGILETAFFALIAVLFFNWQPAPSPELILMFLVPVGAAALRRLSQWEAWAACLGVVAFGIVSLYVAAGPGIIAGDPASFALDLIVSLPTGVAAFFLMRAAGGVPTRTFLHS